MFTWLKNYIFKPEESKKAGDVMVTDAKKDTSNLIPREILAFDLRLKETV